MKKTILILITILTSTILTSQVRFNYVRWLEFDENFCSNHFGTYKECGEWAVPVFPSNISVVGSPKTPYIFDDRLDFRDLKDAIQKVYDMPKKERISKGASGRKWVTSDEANMTAKNMSKNIIKYVDQTFKVFKPRKNFIFNKIEKLKPKKLTHKLIY